MATDPIVHEHRGGHESRDVNARKLAYFAAGLVLALVLIGGFVHWLFFYFAKEQTLGPTPAPFQMIRPLPPEPRLQVEPQQDIGDYLRAQRDTLNSYGWTNKESGTVRIPIDRATELLLQRGLPVRPQQPESNSAGVPTGSGGEMGGDNVIGTSSPVPSGSPTP